MLPPTSPARRPLPRILLPSVAALWVVVTALLAARVAGETVDDFFITFRYSQNLAAGDGFVFNPGERVFGTTAPGWGLLLGGLAVSGAAPALLATVLAAASLLTLALLLLAGATEEGRLPEAAVAGSLMLTSTFLWVHNGSEAFAMMLLLALAARCQPGRPAAAGILAGAAVWLRPEAGLAGLLLGLQGWRDRRRPPLAYGLALAVVVAAGLAAAWLYFGEPLPNTLHAKRLQSAWKPEIWAGGAAFWQEGWRWLGAAYAGPWVGVLVVGGAAGLICLLRSRQRDLQLLAAFAAGLAIAYPLLGVPFYTWYAIPVLMVLLYGLAYLAGGAVRLGFRLLPSRPLAWAAAATVALLLLPLVVHVERRMVLGYRDFRGIPQTELYRTAGLWLREHSRPGDQAAYVEVGTLAYFSRRPVRDLLGLVSPESLEHVERHDLVAAFLARPTEYVVHHTRLAGFMDPLLQQPWFGAAYEPVARFEAGLSADILTLYRRRPGSSLPLATGG